MNNTPDLLDVLFAERDGVTICVQHWTLPTDQRQRHLVAVVHGDEIRTVRPLAPEAARRDFAARALHLKAQQVSAVPAGTYQPCSSRICAARPAPGLLYCRTCGSRQRLRTS